MLHLKRVFIFLAFYASHISYRNFEEAALYLLEQLLQLGGDGIADLGSLGCAANVASADTSLDNVAHSLLNQASHVDHVEGVLHHHGNRQDSSDGVNDTLAGNIGGGAYEYQLAISRTKIGRK